MGMIDRLMNRVSTETLLNQPGMQEFRADLQKQAIDEYEKLLAKLEASKRVPEKIALVKSSMGLLKLQLGERKEGLRLVNEGLGALEKLHEKDPENGLLLTNLSKVKTEIGRAYFDQHDYQKARASLQEALALRTELVSLEPDNIEAGQLLANAEMNLGLLHDETQEPSLALPHYEAADKKRRQLLGKQPENASVLRDQAKGLTALGMFHVKQNNLKRGEECYEEARKAFAKLSERKDRQLDDLLNLGICWKLLGDIAAIRNGKNDLALAIDRYFEGVRGLDELVSANSSMRVYRGTLGKARLNLAQLLSRAKQHHEAFAMLTIALDELQKLRIEDPAFEKYPGKVMLELLRLKKYNKLNSDDLKELDQWIDFATTENGKAWFREVERTVASAPEYPPALLPEESELFTPRPESRR